MFLLQNNLVVILVVTPLFLSLICTIIQEKFSRKLALISQIICVCISFYILVFKYKYIYFLGAWIAPYGIEYQIYDIDIIFLNLVSIISLIGLYVKCEKIYSKDKNLYYSLYLLCISGMLGIIATNDIFNLYVFLEIFSISSYGLSTIGTNRKRLVSAFNYLILGSISACFILIGIGLIYSKTGHLNLSAISQIIQSNSSSSSLKIALIFIIVGSLIKIGFWPFDKLMINLYSNISNPVVFLFSGISAKISIYIIYKITRKLYPDFATSFGLLKISLQYLALITCIIYGIIACYNNNLLKILVYSSIISYSYMLISLSLGQEGILPFALIAISDAFSKPCLFILSKSKLNKINKVILFVSTADIAAFPLTLSFFAKCNIMINLLDKNTIMFSLVTLSSLITFIYSYKIYNLISSSQISISDNSKPLIILNLLTILSIILINYNSKIII